MDLVLLGETFYFVKSALQKGVAMGDPHPHNRNVVSDFKDEFYPKYF